MDKKAARERIEKLKKEIDRYRHSYHVLDKELISPEALDSLKKELFDLEQKFPELVTADSPTQRVGGAPLKAFVKVRRDKPMLSFNDAFSEEDMRDWLTRVQNYLGYSIIGENLPLRKVSRRPSGHGVPTAVGTSEAESQAVISSQGKSTASFLKANLSASFYCELKIDGLAIELIYENGALRRGATRGDGLVGEDITQNLKTIEAIPLSLQSVAAHNLKYKKLIVRGEVFITKNEFARVNQENEKRGEKVFANPRNMAAGSLRQLNPKITAGRKLDSFMYDIVNDLSEKTHEEKHEILKGLGFKTNAHNKAEKTLEEVFEFRDFWEKHREKLAYEIDGVVVILNDNKIFEAAGVIGKAPRAAIAYKFSPREATTTVEDIKIQVGRTGVLTPVAVLRPVEVGGVKVSHATLHNFDQIKRLGVKIGDTVIISRAGDVIPQVNKVLKNLRTGKEKEFRAPARCPIDNSKIVHEGAVYRCSNPKCGARNREFLRHFVSRAAFDIRGLGIKIIDRFLDEGLVVDAADIFTLKKGDIEILERFGEKSAENIISEIEERKKIPLERFIYALGVIHIGEETSRLLAQKVFNFNPRVSKPSEVFNFFKKMTAEKLQEIPDIGPAVAQSIVDYFKDKRHETLIKKFEKAGIEIESRKLAAKSQKLVGSVFVLTGTLEKMSRDEAKAKIRALGGEVSESVSKTTDFVVLGLEPGAKYERAKKLGVKIISEREFSAMLE